MRTFQARIEYAKENVATQKKTLELTKIRFDAELIPKFDVYQASQNLANTESAIPTLKISESQAIHRLSVLLGKPPSELYARLEGMSSIPDAPKEIAACVPADIIRHRPDIRRAERDLASQNARIGIATSELYPFFSLRGVFTLESTNLNEAGDIASRAYSVGPIFSWNVFDGDRVKSKIEFEQARTKELFIRYKRVILEAMEEVENSMVSYKEQSDREKYLEKAVKATKKSVELVQERYINGLSDFQNVLDMERTLFEQQDQLAESKGAAIASLVQLYKSLGGGWREGGAEYLQ